MILMSDFNNMRVDKLQVLDVDGLKVQVDKMKKLNQRMTAIFDSIKISNDYLIDYWSSKTADRVYEEFNNEYKTISNIVAKNDEFVGFLTHDVIEKYSQLSKGISKNTDNLNT